MSSRWDAASPDDDFDMDYNEEDEAILGRGSATIDLDNWEARLRDDVDEDFFMDPRKFHTLHRVIDVLGAQLDEPTTTSGQNYLMQRRHHHHHHHQPQGSTPSFTKDIETLRNNNPAYRALKKQQRVVEDAIEHMAVRYCADLNGAVVQVGKVARQFQDAVIMVRHLRRQVRDIKETLGSNTTSSMMLVTNNNGNNGEDGNANGNANQQQKQTTTAAQAAAMSLRELWLKKLECEAVLSLLEKIEIVRSAPLEFDRLIQPPGPCRIGAAVCTLSRAFDIAFHSNVSHVHALQNVSAQITDRRQRADQIIWDTLLDVIYLRTGNGLPPQTSDNNANTGNNNTGNTGTNANKDGDNDKDGKDKDGKDVSTVKDKKILGLSSTTGSVASDERNSHGMKNPFITKHRLTLANTEIDDDDDDDSMESWFSRDDDDGKESTKADTMKNSFRRNTQLMIPPSLLEAELDLEDDEQRCLEEVMASRELSMWEDENANRNLPRYADHVLALRILVECLGRLKRLDDVERTLSETLIPEIRKIAQKEQAKTFGRLEKSHSHVSKKRLRGRGSTGGALGGSLTSGSGGTGGGSGGGRNNKTDLKDFRRHLTGLLSSFGCVMLRLAHLAQILRHRITTEEGLVLFSYEQRSSAMRPVLLSAYDIMQREVKEFLQACIKEEDEEESGIGLRRGQATKTQNDSSEQGLFSLGITDAPYKKDPLALQPESRANQMQQTAPKFVVNVLMPKTGCSPEVRHALEFRRSLAKWTIETSSLQKELSGVSSEDTSSPSYNVHNEESALHFLDSVIKRQLIPVLQHDAINGTTKALERDDAFDPVIDRTLYGRPNSNEPQDVDMCIACQALYYSTGPLFMALHRLPKDEKMYLHVVGVLEHAILTFISRVKPRVAQICNDKMALRILLEAGTDKEKSFSAAMERRKAFAKLLQAYADGDLLEATQMDGDDLKDPSLMPLSPPPSDTKTRNSGGDGNSAEDLDSVGGLDKEEQVLSLELVHTQSILEFTKDRDGHNIVCCTDEELMKASCLAHSLLKLSSLLDSRLKVRSSGGSFEKTLTSTRALREAIKTIKIHGLKMAKFCRIDMMMQNLTRLSKICKSSTIVAKDAVRIPSCVNDLGEYLTGASDNLREAAGNAVTAYTFSSLEQYIPLFLMQTVRTIARGQGIVSKSPLTLNGVEALDRSGSVLYRDLKGATSFDNSYWDDELAAISFERSASFMAMMEVEMDELEAYYRGNHQEFSDDDFKLMFEMNGPRRTGDPGRYHMLRKKMGLPPRP